MRVSAEVAKAKEDFLVELFRKRPTTNLKDAAAVLKAEMKKNFPKLSREATGMKTTGPRGTVTISSIKRRALAGTTAGAKLQTWPRSGPRPALVALSDPKTFAVVEEVVKLMEAQGLTVGPLKVVKVPGTNFIAITP